MKPKVFVSVGVAVAAAIASSGIDASSAKALTIKGTPIYGSSGEGTTLSVSNERVIGFNPGFSQSGQSGVDVGDLTLDLNLQSLNSGEVRETTYVTLDSYIKGFQYLGREAVLEITGRSPVAAGSVGGNFFILDLRFAGIIKDINDNLLGTAQGSFTAFGTGQDDYLVSVEGTPIPTPVLLPGLVGLAAGILRRNKQENTECTQEAN